ncbi:polysaccharide pyruvyl transferase CsaB [Maledivibacter halophilus]|uniref:Polysaccharide pyruvyl transferase CsaB n=1 Tax=Maledivibacter halophilus TaxID=36842 RepID=A0A1T5JH21_9FIRM|nr:polysaccharide pyruvyl transferase CsaB [Maledivibacter halophilus]SKC50685.1 polysaccharide pyruvyl transferase CsaB [Maledivibacter halophilus]
MKSVFIFGYYGFKNLGDEAILSSIVKMIKEKDSRIEIFALSYNVKYTESTHKINGVSRNSIIDIIKAIKNSSLVISGGGTLLQDTTSSRSLMYYLALIIVAKLFKKPVLFFCNGFGPIKNKFNKFLTKKVANKVDKIVLRDPKSKEIMESNGIVKLKEVTIDAAFSLNGVNDVRAKELLANENIPTDKPLIGISVRPWSVGEDFLETMAKFADYICERDLNVVFIPMQATKDENISNKIIEKMKHRAFILKKQYTPQEVLGIIGILDILVAMRLHALIFAAIKEIPMIGIEYDPKVDSFLKMVKQKNGGKVETLDFLNLCIEFDNLYQERVKVAKNLHDIVEKLKDVSKQNKEFLSKML